LGEVVLPVDVITEATSSAFVATGVILFYYVLRRFVINEQFYANK